MKQVVWTMVGAILMTGTASLALAQYQQPPYGQPSYGQPNYGQPTYTTPAQPGYTGYPSQQGYGTPQQGYGTPQQRYGVPTSPSTPGQGLGAAAGKAVGGGTVGKAVGGAVDAVTGTPSGTPTQPAYGRCQPAVRLRCLPAEIASHLATQLEPTRRRTVLPLGSALFCYGRHAEERGF